MPAKKRYKTKYPGVYHINGKASRGKGTEKIYYIIYRKNGKLIEEKAGRQYQDDMTPAKASGIRAQRVEGKQKSNAQQRETIRSMVTIQNLSDEYFSLRQDNKNKKIDQGRFDNYLLNLLGKKEPRTLVKLDTDRLRVNLLKKLSPQTVKHILNLLKRIINFGVDRGLIAPLPFKISMPKVDNVKTEDLTTEQLANLLKVLETTPYQTAASMMKLALYTGMRRGEIFKLRWDDIDFQRGFIDIRDPKGGKSQKIPMNTNTQRLLEQLPNTNDYLFPARNGGPRKDISKDLNRIKKEAGLPKDFRPMHGLRHFYATMLASSGKVDMYTLQKLMTHKSPQMTQRYAHYRDEALRRASDQVDDILAEAMQVNNKVTVIK